MQRKTGISRPPHARQATTSAKKAANGPSACAAADGGLAAWLARYEPVEREIIEAHERRLANRARRRAEEANMLAGWRAKYENEITARMKSTWWRRMARKRDVG